MQLSPFHRCRFRQFQPLRILRVLHRYDLADQSAWVDSHDVVPFSSTDLFAGLFANTRVDSPFYFQAVRGFCCSHSWFSISLHLDILASIRNVEFPAFRIRKLLRALTLLMNRFSRVLREFFWKELLNILAERRSLDAKLVGWILAMAPRCTLEDLLWRQNTTHVKYFVCKATDSRLQLFGDKGPEEDLSLMMSLIVEMKEDELEQYLHCGMLHTPFKKDIECFSLDTYRQRLAIPDILRSQMSVYLHQDRSAVMPARHILVLQTMFLWNFQASQHLVAKIWACIAEPLLVPNDFFDVFYYTDLLDEDIVYIMDIYWWYRAAFDSEEDLMFLKPRRLIDLCRCAVRTSLGRNVLLPAGIKRLQLPTTLLRYLNFDTRKLCYW